MFSEYTNQVENPISKGHRGSELIYGFGDEGQELRVSNSGKIQFPEMSKRIHYLTYKKA